MRLCCLSFGYFRDKISKARFTHNVMVVMHFNVSKDLVHLTLKFVSYVDALIYLRLYSISSLTLEVISY